MFKAMLVLITAMVFVVPSVKAEVDMSMYPHQLTVTAFYYSTTSIANNPTVVNWQRQFYTEQKCHDAEAATKATKVPRISGDSPTLVVYTTTCDPVVQH